MPHSDHKSFQDASSIKVIPVKHEEGKTCDFAAEVWGVDLNNLNGASKTHKFLLRIKLMIVINN